MLKRVRSAVEASVTLWLLLLVHPGNTLHAQSHAAATQHSPLRVALILRGESFRGGRSGHHYVVVPRSTNVQLANYRSQLDYLVKPFEAAGYEVDVFTAAYKTPYDAEFRKAFGQRLKVFKELDFRGSNQGTNAVANLQAFQEYVNKTGKEYRFMFFVRHDTRFQTNMMDAILRHPKPDDTVWLYSKHSIEKSASESRCKTGHQWNVADRSKITWWANDRIHVMAGKFVPAFLQLLNGPLLLKGGHGPRWANECWAELVPLVGGEEHIAFLEEKVLVVCKATEEQGNPRVKLSRETEEHIDDCDLGVR